MEIGLKLLSEITTFNKYCKYLPELQRRETWEELIQRNMEMHIKKFPELKDKIRENYKLVFEKKVLPSMRSLQFAGKPIELNHARIFNCFSRDTKFITRLGLRSFNDFENGQEITVITHKGNWKKAIVKNYGKQELNELTFRKGRSEIKIKATSNHKWILKDNTETTNLVIGNGIKTVNWFNNFDYYSSSLEERLMWVYGYVYGDGTLLKNKKGVYQHSMVRLCGNQIKYKDRFLELGFKACSPKSIGSDIIISTGTYLKTLPIIESESFECIRAFTRGYLDADGANTRYKEGDGTSLFKSLQTSKKEHFNQIRDLLSVSGFFITGEDDLTGQITNYGIRPETIKFRGFTNFGNSPHSLWYLRDIQESVIQEDVWCLEVEDDHSFVLEGGIVTGNCCYLPIDDYKSFSETMYLLLSGCGVGYSVQFSHIAKLPEINKSLKSRRYVIEDSIIGWADSIKVLLKSYLKGTPKPIFDFGDIRPKGALLITAGGKAPGAEPLKRCLFEIEQILESKNTGEKLKSIECHSIVCLIADAVLSGGIRRSATISLFSFDDEDMVGCKSGNWWEINPHYARANNSAVISRNRITKEEFDVFWERIKASGSGEPGISWTNNPEYGFNPCFRGDMKIKTSEGYKPLESLENQEVELVNSDNKIVKGTVWCSGEKDIYDILTWNNKHIYCTKDHVFLTTDNKETKAEDLVGKRLMPNYDINQEITEYVKLGFIQGDGGLGRLRSEDHLGVEVNIGDRDEDILEIFNYPIVKDKTFYLTGYKELLKQLKFSDKSLPEREFPTNFINWQDKDKLMFLKGLYSANGSIITGHRISFKTTCKNLVNQLRENLEYAGINSYITTNKQKEVEFSNGNYICKESYDINISRYEDVLKFAIKIGFVHKYKQDALRNLILEKAPKVRTVTYKEFGKVYDFSIQEGDNHWGIVEGVIAHNCHEVSLRPYSFCNLTEINGSNIENEEDFYNRCKSASFISTLQASYTDFVYLRPIWKEHTDKDALIGVGITGIASNTIDNSWIKKGAKVVKDTNQEISTLIGINKAARCTVIKPSGTTSCVLGTSSGIHAWYNDYYIRRLRIGKNESLFTYLSIFHPEILEDDIFKSKEQSIISLPIKAPESSLLRNEDVIAFLERVKLYNIDWIKAGHRSGANLNNVSATVNIKDDEWEKVGEWMWNNREFYSGISVLPYSSHTYKQAPFEDISEEKYNELVQHVHDIDLSKVVEIENSTNFQGEVSCGADGCEVL